MELVGKIEPEPVTRQEAKHIAEDFRSYAIVEKMIRDGLWVIV